MPIWVFNGWIYIFNYYMHVAMECNFFLTILKSKLFKKLKKLKTEKKYCLYIY